MERTGELRKMQELLVEALQRKEQGKNASRRLRAEGRIPAVVYGAATPPQALAVNPNDILQILHSEAGHNTIFRLNYGEHSENVLIKDLQLDPVTGSMLHADFLTVAMDQKMTFSVPIEPRGTAEGVKAGGILDISLREVEVQCLPSRVPDTLPIDVTELKIGDTIRVEDLQFKTDEIEILSDRHLVVLSVVPPAIAAEAEAEPEAGIVEGEPQLVGSGQAEEEKVEQS